MGALIAGLSGASIALGVVFVVVGTMRRAPSTTPSTSLWTKWVNRWEQWGRRTRLWVVGALAAGVVTALLTGWLLALVLVPAALLGIPALLTEPPQREIDLLAGLDRWVRLLSPSIATGKSIRDAIIATRNQVPPVLQAPVARLVARIDQGWSTREALLAMADDVASADGDAVLASLAIASARGGVGSRTTLSALGDTIQHRLTALREIAAERAKPRAVVRQVTIITLVVLGAAALFGGSFFDPYRSPLGQVLALALAAAYVGCLVMLRRRTTPQPGARFLKGGTA